MKNKYLIINYGCDDSTELEIELTQKELDFLIDFAQKLNKNSTDSCQPTISIYKDYYKDECQYYPYSIIDGKKVESNDLVEERS